MGQGFHVVSRIYSDKEIYVNVVNAFNLLLEGKTLKRSNCVISYLKIYTMRLKSDLNIFVIKVAPYERSFDL